MNYHEEKKDLDDVSIPLWVIIVIGIILFAAFVVIGGSHSLNGKP